MNDRDLVLRWVHGWAGMRVLRIEEVDGWPLVHVRGPSRETEVVCVDPGLDAFERLARRTAGRPREMLTVMARDLDAYRAAPLPPGIRVDRVDELFMTTTLAPSAPEPVPYTARWDVDGDRATFLLIDGERLAAEGTVGVHGTDAIFDVIETTPKYRRRGLGRHVMSRLTTWAVDHGATTGLLAASADGARLYASIGWDTPLPMWSLMSARP